jgi:hypothetical protein
MWFCTDQLGGFEFGCSWRKIHERQGLVTGAIIDNLVDKGCWKVVIGTSVIEIKEVCTNTDSALIFVDRDRVGDP